MSLRIPWDKYEAAILLDAWLQVKSGVPKLQMINLVSHQLRQKSLNLGIEIDDIFRNTNGISFQLTSMASAYEQKNMGKPASKLFSEISELYRNDIESFTKLREEAMQMVEYTSNLKDEFINYISQARISSVDHERILYAIKCIENFAISTKALSSSIFENFNQETITILRKKVVAHKFFAVRHKDILCYAEKALLLLDEFLITLQNENKSTSEMVIQVDDPVTPVEVKQEEYIYQIKGRFYNWLIGQGMNDNTCRMYVKAITDAEKFAEEHSLANTLLYNDNHTLAEATAIELLNNADFIGFNKQKHNRYSAAIVMLMRFYGVELKDPRRKSNNSNRDYDGDDDFITWMIKNANLRIATARSYRSAINTCDLYAQTHSLYSGSITACSRYDEFILMYTALMEDNGFCKTSEEKHNYLIAALNKYRDYMKAKNNGDAVTTKPLPSPVANNTTVSTELAKRCGAILSEEFDEGYRIGDYMHRTRFLSEYEERYGEEISDNLDDLLKNIGQVRDGRVYYSDKANNTLLSDIYEELAKTFESGATMIYYDCLFEKYSDRLAAEMCIYNADTLKTAMQNDYRLSNEYRFMKLGIVMYGENSDTNGEVRKLLQNSHLPMTYDDIKKHLWYVPMAQIRLSCVQIPECARIDEGTYFYAPNFYISSEEKMALSRAMRSTISTKGFLVAKDLRDIFRIACPSSAMDSEQYKDHSIRNILKVLLNDEFEFSSSTITEKGKTLDYGQIFQNYAAEHERVTLNELLELKKELGLPVIYWDSVFKEMIRISATEMVRKGTVEFDVTAVDRVLEEMYPDEYTPLKDVTLFLNLPPVSVRWNGFLLESFLREYSEKFRLVQLSIAQDDYFGVMLKSTSALENYADVAADMLARNHSWSDERSALQLLKDMKFQQRASNSNISTIIKAAKQKRLNID